MNNSSQHPPQENIKSILNLYSAGKNQEAFDKVEALKNNYPNNALLFNISGVCLKALGRLDAAIKNFQISLDIKPDYFEVSYNLGLTFQQIGNFDNAIKSFKVAIKYKPDYAEAHANLAHTLKQVGHLEGAISSYRKTISIRPNYAEAYNNLGNILIDIGQINEAKKCFEEAIKIKPNFAEAFNNLGNIMRDYGQLDNAYKSYLSASKIKPNFAEVHNNLGIIYSELGEHLLAIESYSNAIDKKKNFGEAYANLGGAQKRLRRLNEATESYQNAIEINPNIPYILGDLINTKMNLCLWESYAQDFEKILIKINKNEKAIRPFPSLALISDPKVQKRIAENFSKSRFHKSIDVSIPKKTNKENKIRVGYFSPDFRSHAVASLISELFEEHDRHKFEIHAFYFGPNTNDEMNLIIKSAVDYYHDVRSLGHKDVALLARKVKLDIAVDLCGYTQDCRPEIFAERAAPTQINYLGYPGTMGVDFMDYIIADKTIIPKKNQEHFSEKIIYMPNSYQVNVSSKDLTEIQFTRQEFGLPQEGFVFCCFNNSYKITPSVFKSWMKILQGVNGSVLWVFESNKNSVKNLKDAAVKHGVSKDRLIFASHMSVEKHLNRIRLADLFLDTLPYNAHTMGSDTLRMGIPLLTCMGETLASRVAASLLFSLNLPEMVTITLEEYVSVAIKLATNQQEILKIKHKLSRNVLSSSLYNTRKFSKDLENAYLQIYENVKKKKKPCHIYVES
jgi:predicted O-linked N-acetylglucosamine transferase (SPINDLY family)